MFPAGKGRARPEEQTGERSIRNGIRVQDISQKNIRS